jgi:hypothetical protein
VRGWQVSLCPRKSVLRDDYNRNPTGFPIPGVHGDPGMGAGPPHLSHPGASDPPSPSPQHAGAGSAVDLMLTGAAAAADALLMPDHGDMLMLEPGSVVGDPEGLTPRRRALMHCTFRFPDGRMCDGCGSTIGARAAHTRRDQCPHYLQSLQLMQHSAGAVTGLDPPSPGPGTPPASHLPSLMHHHHHHYHHHPSLLSMAGVAGPGAQPLGVAVGPPTIIALGGPAMSAITVLASLPPSMGVTPMMAVPHVHMAAQSTCVPVQPSAQMLHLVSENPSSPGPPPQQP